MNSIQESKLTMYRAVALCCTKYAAAIPTVPAFVQIRGALTTNITKIEDLNAVLDGTSIGITEDKASLRDQMCQLTANIASAIYALAAVNQDNTMKEKANYTFRDLMRLQDEVVATPCQNIHDLAEDIHSELINYGITEDMIADQGDAIIAYENKRTLPRQAIESKVAARGELNAVFEDIDELLSERMDKAIVAYKSLHPEFYNEYNASRTIFDPPTIHTRLKGLLLDHLNHPVSEAEITLTLTATNTTNPPTPPQTPFTITALTDDQGNYNLKTKNGTYHLTARKNNQIIYEKTNLKIKLGQITHLDITLPNA